MRFQSLTKVLYYSVVLICMQNLCAETLGYSWNLPKGFPVPIVPGDNPMSDEKVELGRFLFYDTRLSLNGTYSCASCHQQSKAFTDGRAVAIGASGELHFRNSMSLSNVAYNRSFTWASAELRTIEEQIHIPLFNLQPVEMGLSGIEKEVLDSLRKDKYYRQSFTSVFTKDAEALTIPNVVRALAAFVRSMISGNSPYDRFVFHDERVNFPDAAKRGMTLFYSGKTNCSKCHTGFNFSGPIIYREGPETPADFRNTGLTGTDEDSDPGLLKESGKTEDKGKFRVPTLRNLAYSAPYMHDGRFQSLEEVISYYQGGANPHDPQQDELLKAFSMTEREKQDLIAFLHTLSDESFLTNPQYGDPGGNE